MDTIRRCLCGWTITLTALAVTGAVFAQPEPQQHQGFEERVKAIASSFKSNPSLKKLPQTQLESLMNFMVGNMLFNCFTFDKQLLQEWEWSERYPEQPEIL